MEYNETQQPVFEQDFWKARLADAYHYEQLHRAIYICSYEEWTMYKRQHEEILNKVVAPGDSILDCGCGYGRLLTMLPESWKGSYLGIDLFPGFIDIASTQYPNRLFAVGDLRRPIDLPFQYDIAVCISIKPMVIRNSGEDIWAEMERNIRKVAKKILFLEYGDPTYEFN